MPDEPGGCHQTVRLVLLPPKTMLVVWNYTVNAEELAVNVSPAARFPRRRW